MKLDAQLTINETLIETVQKLKSQLEILQKKYDDVEKENKEIKTKVHRIVIFKCKRISFLSLKIKIKL